MKNLGMRFMSLLLLFTLAFSMTAFAQTEYEPDIDGDYESDVDEDWVLISAETTNPSPNEEVRVTVYDAGDDTIITDVLIIETNDNPRLRITTGNLSKQRTITHQKQDITTITIKAKFDYNNSNNVTVTSASASYTSPTNQCRMKKFAEAQGDYNGISTLFKAYAKVNYDVVNWNGTSIGSGKLEITCDVNGNYN